MTGLFYLSYVAMWMLIIIEGVLLLLVYKHFGMVAMGKLEGVQRDGLPVGERAPSITGVTAQGEELTWIPQTGLAHLVAFVSPDCEPCTRVLPYINQLKAVKADLEVTLVVSGQSRRATRLSERFHVAPDFVCLAEGDRHIFDLYRVRVTPFAFAIGGDGHIAAKGLCDSPVRLQELLTAVGVKGAVSIENEVGLLQVAGRSSDLTAGKGGAA